MRWHRLQILVDTVAEMQDEFGYDVRLDYARHACLEILLCITCVFFNRYFLVDADGTVQVQQDGTFRSNCMDCLDRTNVIQSLLARRSLQSQLVVRAAHVSFHAFLLLVFKNELCCGTRWVVYVK